MVKFEQGNILTFARLSLARTGKISTFAAEILKVILSAIHTKILNIMDKRLTKSSNKMIAGVCGGIGEYFGIDPTLVRVGYACLTCFSAAFPGVILYIILCIIMPQN